MQERLQKLLSRSGVASRRAAETLIAQGRVTVNGIVVTELGTKADPGSDEIRVDGVRLAAPAEPVYLLLSKPRGVLSARSDPRGRPTVLDLVPRIPGLFPIGRLDYTTEGLLILTNDGAFAERVAHPRFEVPRLYLAKVRGVPSPETLRRLREGVWAGGERLKADAVRLVRADQHAWLEVQIHEGKNREVRRLLEAVGHPVSKLRRVAIGSVTDRGLQPGQYRPLQPSEVQALLNPQQLTVVGRGKARRIGVGKRTRRPTPPRGDQPRGPGSHRGPRKPTASRGRRPPAGDGRAQERGAGRTAPAGRSHPSSSSRTAAGGPRRRPRGRR